MNTAKTLLLLDAQNNNISPATNIESLYYEVMDNGVIYRNSIYKHFPIYVKYNNNVDNPIIVSRGANTTTNSYIYFYNDTESTDIQKGDTSMFRLSGRTGTREDVFVSSIRQTKLRNTRYYKLDISTYNLSDIMSLYAPKLWVLNNLEDIDLHFDNIIYKSEIILKTTETGDQSYVYVGELTGCIDTTVPGIDLHKGKINEILDKLFFKEIHPYVYDASISMSNFVSETKIQYYNANFLDTTATANFTIASSNGKLHYVHQPSLTPLADKSSKFNIIFDTPSKTFTIDNCTKDSTGYYKDIITKATISSTNLAIPTQKELLTSEYKTNYGNIIVQANYNNIYSSYAFPYNDYNSLEGNTKALVVQQVGTDIKVNSEISLCHRSYLYMPIVAEQAGEDTQVVHITGTGEHYVEFIQNQSKELNILIPRVIDGAFSQTGATVTIDKEKIPTLSFSHHCTNWSLTSDWVISKISYESLYYNKYTINGDNFSGKRYIKIKIYTK